MLDFIHDIFGEHPYFALCVAVFAVGILLFLVARLVRSYPIIFLAVVFVIGATVAAFIDGRSMLGVYWLVFSAIAVIASGLHLYKNIRGAFWFSLGAVVAMIVSALPIGGGVYEPKTNDYKLVGLLLPIIIFLAIGLLGGLLVPRLMFKNKDERKHRTNTDNLIGQSLKITRETEDGLLRGSLGDVDWQIEPFLPNEKFKVGDKVVIHHIKGVTLVCTRDGKDLRNEQAEKRRQEAEKAQIENEKKRAERDAKKAADRLESEKAKAKRDEEKAKHDDELRKIKEERAAQKAKEDEELRKVREARLAAARARKEELAKERAEAKAKKEAEAKAKPAKEPKAKPAKEPKAKEEKPAKEAKAEKVVKEKPAKEPKQPKVKPAKVKKQCNLTKRELIYICLSVAIVLVCIVIIVLCCIKSLRGSIALTVFIFLFFALAVAYLIAIFILEALNKKEEKPVEEKKAEPVKVEEPKAEPAPAVEKKEKAEFVPFSVRMKEADPFVREAYNELKSEVLSYGIKSRVSSTSDRFRLHKKEYVKMVIAGQFLKLYFALNPEDYKNTTYPFDDAGRMGAHKDTPFVFKIKSGLSVRRAKQLINDVASKDALTQGEVEAHDWASELENMIAESDDDEE